MHTYKYRLLHKAIPITGHEQGKEKKRGRQNKHQSTAYGDIHLFIDILRSRTDIRYRTLHARCEMVPVGGQYRSPADDGGGFRSLCRRKDRFRHRPLRQYAYRNAQPGRFHRLRGNRQRAGRLVHRTVGNVHLRPADNHGLADRNKGGTGDNHPHHHLLLFGQRPSSSATKNSFSACLS